MRTHTTIRGMAALVAATVLGLTATGAAAEETKDQDTGHDVLNAEEASFVDARIVAGQHDWEVKGTLQYLEESRTFADLAADLAGEFPNTFASATYADQPGGTSLVRFVDDPPRDAVERIEKSGLRVKVGDDARYSKKQLQERAGKVHDTLLESGYTQVVTATNPDDRIEATVYGEGNPELPRDLAEGVRVTESERPVARDEHTRGGAPLFDDGNFECTSGFTVQDGNGTTGVATAGHCNGLNQYRQPSDGLVYGMSHQGQHYGFWGDAEWKTTPHLEPAEYFATATQLREVNSVSSWLPVNTPSCVYGRSSNDRACDRVYSSFVIATFSGPTHWFLMAMDNDNTVPGDSGGPWSFATEADGIHKGDITLGGGRRNVWTRASLLPVSLGVSVRTQ